MKKRAVTGGAKKWWSLRRTLAHVRRHRAIEKRVGSCYIWPDALAAIEYHLARKVPRKRGGRGSK